MKSKSLGIAAILLAFPLSCLAADSGPDTLQLADLMGRARFDAAEPLLAQCRQVAERFPPEGAFKCGLIRAGILRAQGRASEWAEQVLWIKRDVLPRFSDQRVRVMLEEGLFGDLDYQQAARLPVTHLSLPAGQIDIPLIQDGERSPSGAELDRRYVISMEINGRPVEAAVDTGAVDVLTLPRSMVDALGIDEVLGAATPLSLPLRGVMVEGEHEYRLARQVRLGGIYYSNLMVRVHSDSGIPVPIIGTGFLSRFASVAFEPARLLLNVAREPDHCDAQQLRFAPSHNLSNSNFLMQVEHDRVTRTALIDTGMPGVLGFVNPLAEEIHNTAKAEGREVLQDKYAPSTAYMAQSVTFGEVTVSDETAALFLNSSEELPYQIVMGTKLKSGVVIYLDFDEGSFCLAPVLVPGKEPARAES